MCRQVLAVLAGLLFVGFVVVPIVRYAAEEVRRATDVEGERESDD